MNSSIKRDDDVKPKERPTTKMTDGDNDDDEGRKIRSNNDEGEEEARWKRRESKILNMEIKWDTSIVFFCSLASPDHPRYTFLLDPSVASTHVTSNTIST